MPRKKSLREDLRLKDPDHNPASSELLEHIGLERFNAKKREPSSTKKEVQWSSDETRAKHLKMQTNPVNNHSE